MNKTFDLKHVCICRMTLIDPFKGVGSRLEVSEAQFSQLLLKYLSMPSFFVLLYFPQSNAFNLIQNIAIFGPFTTPLSGGHRLR